MKRISDALSQDLSSSTPTSVKEQTHNVRNFGIHNKGWSSERVPLPSSNSTASTRSGHRHVSSISLSPFNSRRALPSKWDEAERWICSPALTGYGTVGKALHHPKPHGVSHRRPKSKSGPIMPPRNGQFPGYSPTNPTPMVQGLGAKNYMMSSPLLTGVLLTNGVYSVGHSAPAPMETGYRRARPSYLHEQPEVLQDASLSKCQGEEQRRIENAETRVPVSHTVQQLEKEAERKPSINDDSQSSVEEVPSFHCHQEDSESCNSKLEFRDVLVDRGTTVSRRSKRHVAKEIEGDLRGSQDYKKDIAEPKAFGSNIAGEPMKISILERKEAKITAWENLQKANAEAEIRKLEVNPSSIVQFKYLLSHACLISETTDTTSVKMVW